MPRNATPLLGTALLLAGLGAPAAAALCVNCEALAHAAVERHLMDYRIVRAKIEIAPSHSL